MAGIDIGCQHDRLNATFRGWDLAHGDGDATFMEGVPDAVFMTVYASHVLEHLDQPRMALQSWWRILAPGGHLIVVVPHRDLYERRTELPSQWNQEHKTFWLPDVSEPPCTLSLAEEVCTAISSAEIVSLHVLDTGYDGSGDGHPQGEYSIEIIARKA